ncbi:MAG: VOC family protein [Bacteroidota bacterium]
MTTAKEWYIKATGIEPYFDEPFYVGFDINGFELGLDPNAVGGSGNQTVSYWSVDDTEFVSKKLVEIGGTMIQSKTNVGEKFILLSYPIPSATISGLLRGHKRIIFN